ncbi:MAG: Fe-S cluster assembly protein SufD, partial [Fuerstiella sp.]|nr:Fe-S cluster assembly protein SufD [Fuerstiella sp.]
MTVTIDIDRIGFSAEVFEAFLSTRSEASWITDARRAAFAKYEELLGEELNPEEFKRVDLRIFNAAKFRPSTGESDESSVSTLLASETEYGGSIRHVDGATAQANVSEDITSQGVLFGDLQTLLTENRELLEPYFLQQAVRPDADRFAAWHAAFWTSGTLLYVPKGVEVELPLHSLIAHT